jgi:hypothetical protein
MSAKKLILNQVKRASHLVKIVVAGPHRLPKLPESTERKQAIPNKGSLFYSHCVPAGGAKTSSSHPKYIKLNLYHILVPIDQKYTV